MLRLALVILALWPAAAWADGAPSAGPIEVQWLDGAIHVISQAGMPGVILALLYALKLQWDTRKKEHEDFKSERREIENALKEERDYNRKMQEDRVVASAASAERLATVAVSSSNAIATSAEKNAGLITLAQEIKEMVTPIAGEHSRIITNQEGLSKDIAQVNGKVGTGCRAP